MRSSRCSCICRYIFQMSALNMYFRKQNGAIIVLYTLVVLVPHVKRHSAIFQMLMLQRYRILYEIEGFRNEISGKTAGRSSSGFSIWQRKMEALNFEGPIYWNLTLSICYLCCYLSFILCFVFPWFVSENNKFLCDFFNA